MMRAAMRVVGGLVLLLAPPLPAADPPAEVAVARLQRVHATLAAHPDPGQFLTHVSAIGTDLAAVVSARLAGRLPAERVRELTSPEGARWSRFQGLPLLLYGTDSAPAPLRPILAELGILPPGTNDVHSFFIALESLSPRPDGGFALAATLEEHRTSLLPAWRALAPDATVPAAGQVATQLHAAVWWPDLERFNRAPLVWSNYFRVVARSDLPWPPADRPLARAFIDVAAGPPSAYARKWWAHGVLLDLMDRMLRREAAGQPEAVRDLLAAPYRLLCHAVLPATPFRPRPADEAGRVWHFAQPWEEDQPLQGIFSRDGHVLQITTVQTLLGPSGTQEFDPGRHLFLVPFDAAPAGERWQVRSRRYAYLGYLDAFATREYPFLLRAYSPEAAAP